MCTGFGFTLQPVAQSRLSADVAGLLCALSPFVAAVLGAVFLGEAVTPCRLAGMALIAVAMLVASLPRGLTPRGLTPRAIGQRLRRPRPSRAVR